MPQFLPVTLNDHAASPVVFDPSSIDSAGVARFINVPADGVYVGAKSLAVSLRKTPANTKARVLLKLPVVTTEVINGVSEPKVVRTAYADVTFTFDTRSTLVERQHAIAMLAHGLTSSTLINGVVEEQKDIY